MSTNKDVPTSSWPVPQTSNYADDAFVPVTYDVDLPAWLNGTPAVKKEKDKGQAFGVFEKMTPLEWRVVEVATDIFNARGMTGISRATQITHAEVRVMFTSLCDELGIPRGPEAEKVFQLRQAIKDYYAKGGTRNGDAYVAPARREKPAKPPKAEPVKTTKKPVRPTITKLLPYLQHFKKKPLRP